MDRITNYRFFEVADDSMEPAIGQSDTIIVDTVAEIRAGDIVLARLVNGVFVCRRAYQTDHGYILKADNSPHDIPDESVLHIIGKVAKKI